MLFSISGLVFTVSLFPFGVGEVETREITHPETVVLLDFQLTWTKGHVLFIITGHRPKAQPLILENLHY